MSWRRNDGFTMVTTVHVKVRMDGIRHLSSLKLGLGSFC